VNFCDSEREGTTWGTVHALAAHETATIIEAADAYLATLAGPESAGTRRVYSGVLRALAEDLGADTDVADLKPRAVAAWFTSRWGERSPSRWNTALDALRSASRYWIDQGWLAEDPARMLRRRRKAADRSRALSRADVERLLTRDDISIRERTLWRLLYETAARSAEVLRLDVEDLDLPNRKAKVRRKGGAIDTIVWQTGTARLLPRLLLKGRKSGPVFLTDRRARVQLPPGDIDQASGKARLSYRQAGDLFKEASGGATLHQLRHSALTHDAEAGALTPMLMAKPGHTSVARYARPSAEALARWQEQNDPARRR
jgi:integrase/recombinase XerC/integrase/recombinase XerD